MATKNNYSLIRGRRMRVTRLDGCGRPITGEAGTAVTDGFVSVGFTAQTTEAEEIVITNAAGESCARDPGKPEFNGYQLEITFCGVQPCIFEMITGQPPVEDALGDVVGFKMNSSISQTANAFALEIWAGVPGVACTGSSGSGSFGYILIPFSSTGVVGDFTVENAAVNFVVSGAATKDGNTWGSGPYNVVPDASGAPAPLPEPLDKDDHLYVVWTPIAPPEPTDGCVALEAAPLTGVIAGTPGSFQPPTAAIPANLTALNSDPVVGTGGSNAPTTAWTVGQYVVLGDSSSAHWSGTAWVSGAAPAVAAAASRTSTTSRSK